MTVAIITALYDTRSWKKPIPQRSKSFSVNPTTKNLETRRTRSNRNRDRGGMPEWTREESKRGARLTSVAALSKVPISLSKAPTPKTLPPLTLFFFLSGPPFYANPFSSQLGFPLGLNSFFFLNRLTSFSEILIKLIHNPCKIKLILLV